MNDTDIYEEYFEEADDIARTDSEAEGTVYKNSYASLMNELQPSTSFDDFKQSISHITEIFRTDPARMQYGEKKNIKHKLQQWFIENPKISARIRSCNVLIKLLTCILYCFRVVNDERTYPEEFPLAEAKEKDLTFYEYLLWVDFDFKIWFAQTFFALISMVYTILVFYLSYSGSVIRLLINIHFLLELITSFPFILSIFIPSLTYLYVPVFLNCWLAKGALQAMMNDLNRKSFISSSALFRQLLLLFTVLACLIFTGMCSIEHLQRARAKQIDLFTSFYFVMVTFSTVGYGDWYPDYWASQLCVVILICVALGLIPKQLDELGQTWSERQKSGTDFSSWNGVESHVVVTITTLEVEFIRDFLEEFYAHPENQRIQVVLLSPAELDNQTRMLLKIPLWNNRVHYVRGSSLRDEDLERARVSTAKACFILSARHVNRKVATDEHTILRSWAIKDFAPNVRQYVQIFRAETKMHIEHAEVLICEDEFKYALLANNCICPGISTFITLLMHTSRGEEGQKSTEPWHKVYGFHSGNEMYQIRVQDSRFFGEYVGKSFSSTSFHAHKEYGIGLIAVAPEGDTSRMKLNPGSSHIIQSTDTVYYMGLTNEESLTDFRKGIQSQQKRANVASTIANVGSVAVDVPHEKTELATRKKKKRKEKAADEIHLIEIGEHIQSSRRPSIAMVTEGKIDSSSDSDQEEICDKCRGPCIQHKLQRTYPQVRTYIGTSNTVCHMMKERRSLCCLKLDEKCAHKSATSAHEYQWRNRPIILAADRTSSGMYNLVIPLRAYYRPVHDLHPIIILLELEEQDSLNDAFLDAISYFPDVYWMKGKIGNLDCLLRAGVSSAEHVVVVKETAVMAEEHTADCNTIITVQKIHRMFPRLRMITELTHATNMRFVQFNPNNAYSLAQSRFEKKERKRGSHMPFMFRLPFAQGGVFSANMLDRLLYQAIIKPFVVDLVRLLLGIDQHSDGGYLTSFVITSDDLWIRNYGRLYQKLCSSVADIPIGIFRTKKMDTKTVSLDLQEQCKDFESTEMNRNKDMYDHVKNRMRVLNIRDSHTLLEGSDEKSAISYVIINPAQDLELESGDIVYVIRSPIRKDATNARINPRRGLRRSKNVSETMDSSNNQVPVIVIDENNM
ncbi:hypothetical protein L3Y34_011046 [Caenorhabditis briggsae]|uniref:RCK N-terminal domain-containing protein n=1 Tax=Caenorhabditis briggsae TaxID=6238 RepID=A0AAE9CTY5_CAEBR|nr:hypothetical protein L3Y34_011046 [Caenorhabditis briggsae]